MPKTDEEPLGPIFDYQLRSALDRVQPRFSAPRYARAGRLPGWHLAPVALAIAITGVLALSVSAATGKVNPAVVMNRISTAIEPTAEPSQTPEPTPKESPKAIAPVQAAPQPEPKETPEPSERPEPVQSASTPAPTPEPVDDGSVVTNPSPSPDDH